MLGYESASCVSHSALVVLLVWVCPLEPVWVVLWCTICRIISIMFGLVLSAESDIYEVLARGDGLYCLTSYVPFVVYFSSSCIAPYPRACSALLRSSQFTVLVLTLLPAFLRLFGATHDSRHCSAPLGCSRQPPFCLVSATHPHSGYLSTPSLGFARMCPHPQVLPCIGLISADPPPPPPSATQTRLPPPRYVLDSLGIGSLASTQVRPMVPRPCTLT